MNDLIDRYFLQPVGTEGGDQLGGLLGDDTKKLKVSAEGVHDDRVPAAAVAPYRCFESAEQFVRDSNAESFVRLHLASVPVLPADYVVR